MTPCACPPLVLSISGGAAIYSQTAAAPAFEVASVRHAAPDARSTRFNGGPGTSDPERFVTEKTPAEN